MNKSLMRIFPLLIFSIILIGINAFANNELLTAIVDRNQLSMDETLKLTVRYTGTGNHGQPDFTKLEQNFDIMSRESGNKIFGDMSNLTALTEWTFILSPKKEGELTIPAFSYGSLKSTPTTVKVTPVKAAPKGQVKDIFLETVVEKESLYVQEQLILKYRLFYSMNVDSLEREPIEIENVINEQLPDIRYNRKINNKLYGIAEFNYALYPQTSGEFEIPEMVWDIKIPKTGRSRSTFFDFNGRYEIKRLRTESKTVKVLPKSNSFPDGKAWIPAKTLTLEEKWSKTPLEFTIGEPITRTITLKADGLTASQLPQIWASQNDGNLKVYTDQPELKDERLATGSISQRIESAAVVVSKAGEVELPALRVPWWDVNSNSVKIAELPARKLQVKVPKGFEAISSNQDRLPVVPSLNATQSAEDIANLGAAQREIWLWRAISALLGAALLILLIKGYFFGRKYRKPSTDNLNQAGDKASLASLMSACKKNSASEIRTRLIAWANEQWKDSRITTLDQISRRIGDPNLSKQLVTLDSALFAPKNDPQMPKVDGSTISNAIEAYLQYKKTNAQSRPLEEFYAT